MSKLLEVNDLATHFLTENGVVKAVDGVTYHIEEGEILGVVGESGCGKSVNALSIMRLVADPPGRIVRGEIVFEGRDMLQLTDAEMRTVRGNRIGMIFQEPMTSLNPVLTIGRQITEPLETHLRMSPRRATERAIELLDMVGITDAETRMGDYPHHLSGGMRQRVMIAIAISCNPKLLIADEPTTALDVTIQAQILELMQSLAREMGTAMMIITHNLGVVARYANRVMVMYAGKLTEIGSSESIYTDSRHPYTLGLLESIPRLDQSSELHPIVGTPPDLIHLPDGCSFADRCRFAAEKCNLDVPSMIPITVDHQSACWRSLEIPDIARDDS